MEPSHRIVPANPPKSASFKDTANSLLLHDTLQYGPRTIAAEVKSDGSLKQRLESWDETQDNMKLALQRNIYGIHAPVRLLMERKIVSANPHLPGIQNSNLHLDILMGRDEAIEPSDIFLGSENVRAQSTIHQEMEKSYRV